MSSYSKTDDKLRLLDARKRYEEAFGEPYGLTPLDDFETIDEVIEDIEGWLDKGQPKPEPEYGEGRTY